MVLYGFVYWLAVYWLATCLDSGHVLEDPLLV